MLRNTLIGLIRNQRKKYIGITYFHYHTAYSYFPNISTERSNSNRDRLTVGITIRVYVKLFSSAGKP